MRSVIHGHCTRFNTALKPWPTAWRIISKLLVLVSQCINWHAATTIHIPHTGLSTETLDWRGVIKFPPFQTQMNGLQVAHVSHHTSPCMFRCHVIKRPILPLMFIPEQQRARFFHLRYPSVRVIHGLSLLPCGQIGSPDAKLHVATRIFQASLSKSDRPSLIDYG